MTPNTRYILTVDQSDAGSAGTFRAQVVRPECVVRVRQQDPRLEPPRGVDTPQPYPLSPARCHVFTRCSWE
eukprot:1176000-Prorocentrum_minimum.AAC.1